MKQNFKKKVCIIVDCLTGGGAERAAAQLSIKLSEKKYQIFIISVRDEITYNFSGKLYNLGLNESNLKLKKQFDKLYAFKKAYKSINADIYIDFRMRNRPFMERLLHSFVFDISKMVMAIRSYNVFYHMPKSRYFKLKYNNAKAIVGVSKGIQERLLKFHDFKNVIYIPNFFNKENVNKELLEAPINLNKKFILAVGRLDNEIKQFNKLILTYKDSEYFNKGVSLVIIGEGKDRMILENLINDNKLTNSVELLGFRDNVYAFMRAAKVVLLTSTFEGFPNVLLESLALGTPVISFNCKTGPSEMVIDGENGILVEDQNFNAFKEAINKMAVNKSFYEYCKLNATSSVSKFSEEKVLDKWVKLIES